MTKIDTNGWSKFVIGDLFDIHPTKAYKLINNQLFEDGGTNPVVVNSGFNNGIGGYTNRECTESAGIITFTDTAAKSAVSFFYQERDFVGYPHVQGMYPKNHKLTKNESLFLTTVIRASVGKYDFIFKMTRDDILNLVIKLPSNSDGSPNWEYMGTYMQKVFEGTQAVLESLGQADAGLVRVNIKEWQEFQIGKLFPKIVKPPVYHAREVMEDEVGIPYVVRTKFGNGIKCRVQSMDGVEPSPAGVITWGAENAAFFYQTEPFLSGRDIYYVDTREYSPRTCLFLASCFQTVAHKYPYNFGLFPDLLREERIKLPTTQEGDPDWAYMDAYMDEVMRKAEIGLDCLRQV